MPTVDLSYKTLAPETLLQLEQLDACSVSNAIEQFAVRSRNEGFVSGVAHCMFPRLGSRVGYAVTARMRSSSTPIAGRCYYDRADWWAYVQTIPAPRFIVVQDVDERPGFGALFGEVHANISKALECSAYLTNGSVRDLPGIEAAGFQLFAGSIALSHAYAHVIEYGSQVEIGGLRIAPGDLLHGDQHGVQSIPISIADQIPAKVKEMLATENELIALCRSKHFSFEELTRKMRHVSSRLATPDKDSK
ncbi:MAG TPA: RraA family protein [Bryobacteraceae bacterium]|jgi:regulator of RNase E activity RraA|nr:RraA family protein [Bryobacteraceae bacterium]